MLRRNYHAVVVLGLAACGTGGPDRLVGPGGDASKFVVGAAAEALDADGRFRFPAPRATRVDAITKERAIAIANAWVVRFGPPKRSTLEVEHGGRIDFAALKPCPRAYYAESPFEPLPPDYHPLYQRRYGPWWIVGMCDRGERAVLSVAVSAYASDIHVEGSKLRMPQQRGVDVYLSAVGSDWDDALADSPERAVRRVVERTGVRVSETPVLVAPNPHIALPQAATWRLRVERPVRVVGRSMASGEIFVGTALGTAVFGDRPQPSAETFLAADSQPAHVSFRRVIDPFDIVFSPNAVRYADGRAARRLDMPIQFYKVSLEGGANP